MPWRVCIYRTMTPTHKTLSPPGQSLSHPAPLAPQWAFVVQLRQGTSLSPKQMQGRIEHVCSGRATTFTSWAEAHAFMVRVLAEIEAEKPP